MARNIKIKYVYVDIELLARKVKSMTTDAEKAAWLDQSIKELQENKTDGDSECAEVIRKALAHSIKKRAIASRRNGRLGGRPRKTEKTITEPLRKPPVQTVKKASQPREFKIRPHMPNTAELYAFASRYRLDEADARQWFEMTLYRRGCDRDGNIIQNWQGACRNFCKAKMASRGQPVPTVAPRFKVPPSAAMIAQSTPLNMSQMDIRAELSKWLGNG
jgi:hypothetical protein